MPNPEDLVHDLRTLSKRVGERTIDGFSATPNLLALRHYGDFPLEEERRVALLADLDAAVAGLPDAEQSYARYLLSYEAAGTNLTHRRKLAGMDSVPNNVMKWREHYILALVAARLIRLADHSLHEESGPGYRHEHITHRVIVDENDPLERIEESVFDIRIIRDGVYLYLIGERARTGYEVIRPWHVTTGQLHVGDAPFDSASSDGAKISVIALGRRYVRDEPVRIGTSETVKHSALKPKEIAATQMGRLPSSLLIEVQCPLRFSQSYERIEFEDNSVNAAPRDKTQVDRKSNEPMRYKIQNASPLTRYAIHWTPTTEAEYT